MFDIVFSLTECTLPIHAIIVLRSKCHFHQLASYVFVIHHIDSFHNSNVSIRRLLFVDLVIITECAIIHFITSILKLFQVLLPNILVFLEILQHFGIAILTLVPIKWIYFFLLSAKGLIIFVSLRYLLYKLQKLVIIKWFRIIFMFFMLVRFNLARIPFNRFRQPVFI